MKRSTKVSLACFLIMVVAVLVASFYNKEISRTRYPYIYKRIDDLDKRVQALEGKAK